jgi:glycosyltransferase involved in cell wall biosynthesis
MGAQARMHGLTTELARRHEVTVVSLTDGSFDADSTGRALSEYCHEFALVASERGRSRWERRFLQGRSLFSGDSFLRHRFRIPELQAEVDRVLSREPFDVVELSFPYFFDLDVRKAPPGSPHPALVIDMHDIGYDLVRQVARSKVALGRRVFAALNWPKLAREERACYRLADGICVCSEADMKRVLSDVPSARVAVIPNAADVGFFQPRVSDPPADGRTLLFFGLLSTFPNVDGMRFFLGEIWPRIATQQPNARLKIIGAQAPEWLKALAGPRIEIAGVVEDLRPHLAEAATVVVPLRLGSGTRLKIVEALAMAKPVVSTRLGAEGIDAVPGRDLLIADDAAAFAAAVGSILDDPDLARRLGSHGRSLVHARYSWSGAARALERFFGTIVAQPRSSGPEKT